MASIHEYKQFENNIVHKVKKASSSAGRGIAGVFGAFGRFLTRRYTVVFVPHSEKKVYNFHISILSIICFFLVIGCFFGAFFWYGTSVNSSRFVHTGRDTWSADNQASLDQMRDEIALLSRDTRRLASALSETFSVLSSDPNNRSSRGDLESILNIRETPDGASPEIEEIRRLIAYINTIIDPVTEIGAVLNSQREILTDMPSIWPVQGGLGRITMYFGHNRHPFTGQYYIHRGIDISTFRSGDPIVATANGQVVNVEFAGDYGNNIVIRHKHGHYTRYAHLLSARVRLGQRVQQGEVIGFIGNTGLSTGPHLHYEVQIGADVVDPYRYMTMRTSVAGQRR